MERLDTRVGVNEGLCYLVAGAQPMGLCGVAQSKVSPLLSAPRLFNRRQSLGLAAWALLGAGCDAGSSDPQSGAAPNGKVQSEAAPGAPPGLGEGLSDPIARRFYELRSGKPAWTAAQGTALTRSFREAHRHGLNPVAFALEPDPGKQAPGDDPNEQDIALTLAALRYARALAFGFVDPQSIEKVFTLERNVVDLAAGLDQALDKKDLPGWLASLAPADAEYKALSTAYLAAIGPVGAPTPSSRVGRCQGAPDQSSPDQSSPDESSPDESSSGKSAADREAPGQNTPDQNAPPQGAPSQALPEPVAQPAPAQAAPSGAAWAPPDRARQLAANLERRRWISRSPPATRIDVNTASCVLGYVTAGTVPWQAPTVCGKPGHDTPSVQGSFHRLVANPPWRVPMDIARKEILRKGRGYMRREHMHWVNGRIVQQPGPRNSLGLVKFDVDDPYEIYLHDTPSKSLFALPDRHKSHGCVRVQNALGLARLIAGRAGKSDEFEKALASGKTGEVDIGEAIPVRMLYHTAFADEGGQIGFVPDIYGWNDKLATALGLGPATSNAASQEPDVDVGP